MLVAEYHSEFEKLTKFAHELIASNKNRAKKKIIQVMSQIKKKVLLFELSSYATVVRLTY